MRVALDVGLRGLLLLFVCAVTCPGDPGHVRETVGGVDELECRRNDIGVSEECGKIEGASPNLGSELSALGVPSMAIEKEVF